MGLSDSIIEYDSTDEIQLNCNMLLTKNTHIKCVLQKRAESAKSKRTTDR